MDRRNLLSLSAAGLMLPSGLKAQSLTPTLGNLPSPDFGGRFQVWKGLRPYRTSGLRLEVIDLQPNLLIHNYGHGGGGITLSWGCANWVRGQLHARSVSPATTVAVLGSGVIGLTTATVLAAEGYKVTIYTDKLWRDTTSAVAGGQIAPSLVEPPTGISLQALVDDSYKEHSARGKPFGVAARDNYAHAQASDLDMVAKANGTSGSRLGRLPFKNANAGGWVYKTLLANPTILLPKLERDLRDSGVVFVVAPLTRPVVDALAQPIVVNCLGLGSGAIWPDDSLYAKKGILAVFPPQTKLNYLYSSIGYVFPRSDHLIVGGTIEDLPLGVRDRDATSTPNIKDEQKAQFVVRIVRRVFNGDLPVPAWFSGAGRIPDGMFKDSNIDLGYVPPSST